MMGRRIVGVDAGYVNFAVCGIDTSAPDHPYYWKVRPLFTGTFSEERLAKAVYAWINLPEVKELLENADEIILERQMTMKFQAVNHCIRFLYFDKTKEVHPNTVRALFRLPETRRAKKKAAVDLVASRVIFPIKKGKKDDLADSFLLALYAGIITFPAMAAGWVELEPAQKRLKSTINLV
jgi:hypothetical protein